MPSYDWQLEMENMLAAFNRQAIHSLSIIKLAFNRNGLSFTLEFKEHFVRTSTNRILKSYDRFQINSMLDVEITTKRSPRNDTGQMIAPVANSDSNYAMEMDETNDSINLPGTQSDSTVTDDSQLIPSNVVLNCLNEEKMAELTRGKTKTLKRKSPNKKGMKTTTGTYTNLVSAVSKGAKSPPKQLARTNPKTCTVCGYVTFQMGHFNRHMRTHTGEKPHRCDQCGKRFTRTEMLMKHVATHIRDIPMHCRACFRGFSLKDEALAHEKQCRKRHYECHLCKTFVTFDKPQLITHMRKHTGDKPFCCRICMKHFIQKQNLKKHLNTIHVTTNK